MVVLILYNMEFLYINTSNRPLCEFKLPKTIKFDFKLNPNYDLIYPPLIDINYETIKRYEKDYGFEVLLYALTGKETHIEMVIIELNSTLEFGDNSSKIKIYKDILNNIKENDFFILITPNFMTKDFEFCELFFNFEVIIPNKNINIKRWTKLLS